MQTTLLVMKKGFIKLLLTVIAISVVSCDGKYGFDGKLYDVIPIVHQSQSSLLTTDSQKDRNCADFSTLCLQTAQTSIKTGSENSSIPTFRSNSQNHKSNSQSKSGFRFIKSGKLVTPVHFSHFSSRLVSITTHDQYLLIINYLTKMF